MIRPLLIALLCLPFALAASAQDASSGASSTPDVSVRFTVIGWSGKAAAVAYMQDGQLEKLTLPPFSRSKPYDYTGPARMALYDPKTKDGQPVQVGEVDFPQGAKRFTVLVGKTGNDHYTARVIVDDEAGFPLGTARVYNLTAYPMLIRYNQASTVVIQPGQSDILHPRADLQLVSQVAFQRDGQWQRGNDDFIYVPRDAQTSAFYFQSDSGYFKSIDGGSRTFQLLVLPEKPASKRPEQTALTAL